MTKLSKVPGVRVEIAKTYGELASTWDGRYVDAQAVAENTAVFHHVLVLPEHGRVLELACGTGLLLDWVRVHPDRYLGVDISAEMVHEAKLKHPKHTFIVGDMDTTNFPADSFAAVVLVFAGWSYSLQPNVALRTLHRALHDKGSIFLMAYGPGARDRAEYLIASSSGEPIPRRIWSAREMHAALELAGFNNVSARGVVSGKLTAAFKGDGEVPVRDVIEDYNDPKGDASSSFIIGIGYK